VVEAINRLSADTGVTAYLTSTGAGAYTVDLMSSKLDSAGAALTNLTLTGFTAATTGLASAGTVEAAVATLSTGTGIDILTVDTQANSWVALKKIDDAIDQVNSARADLGALQSRFESAVGNIEIQVENLSASRGRIVDADFAKETANLSRTQILQQAGTAMVAQANQLPQGVLALLR
jgi:flagellin